MTIAELMESQLQDPFRIALLFGLVYTTQRNRAATGLWLPLAAGIIFVAVLLPSSVAALPDVPFWHQVLSGVAINTILGAAIFAMWEGLRRFMQKA